MTPDYLSQRRPNPLHQPASQPHAAETTPENNTLQQDAAATADVQQHEVAPDADYTISVDQVREHLRGKGLVKSKDTIQRWCRAGDLDCKKLGLLGRYFTTESSLSKLERKLLPDMIAEQTGASNPSSMTVPPDAPAGAKNGSVVQQHAAVDEPASSDLPKSAADHAPAPGAVQVHTTSLQPDAGEELAKLRAENTGLREQLDEAKENAKFLREEIISARGQRGDVVKIAEQMLGTLETIAVGGRLEKPSARQTAPEASPEPVHFEAVDPNASRV
jgi:hypothetical protein